MWNVTTKFGYLYEVWARFPVFFHGKIVGFYIDQKGQGVVYVCESANGNLLHVKEEDLKRPKKQEELNRSI